MQQKSDFILAFTDVTANIAKVGGKGASLARMAIAGFPVPDGFHITTEAYRQFVMANGLQTKILAALKDVDTSLPTSLETASVSINRFFANANIPNEIIKAIRDSYLTLDTSHFYACHPTRNASRARVKAARLSSVITLRATISLPISGQEVSM